MSLHLFLLNSYFIFQIYPVKSFKIRLVTLHFCTSNVHSEKCFDYWKFDKCTQPGESTKNIFIYFSRVFINMKLLWWGSWQDKFEIWSKYFQKKDDKGAMTKTRFKFIRLFLKFLHFQCGIGHALWSLKVEWEQCGCQLIASIGLALSAANQENEFLCILLLCLNT